MVEIPRIAMTPSDTELPFTLRRRQFPIRPDDVFTHGQLYVAFSRVRNASSSVVCVWNSDGYTRNIVYH